MPDYNIFDSVFSNPAIQSILGQGLSPNSGATPTQPTPFPTPAAPPMAGPSGLGNPGMDMLSAPPPPTGAPMMPPLPPASSVMGTSTAADQANGTIPMPGAMPSGGAFPQPPAPPLPPDEGGFPAPGQATMPSGMPLPPVPPQRLPPSGPGNNPVSGMPTPTPPGYGANAIGGASAPNKAAVPGLISGLASALGVNTPQGVQAMMAGIGKGLGAIQGPGRFASFARGAGLGVSGTISEQDKQEAQKIARANNLRQQDLTNAQIGNYNALAKAREVGSLAGGKQLLLTDAGKVQAADREALAVANMRRQTYMEELKTADAKRADEIRKELTTVMETARSDALKRYGLDPDKAEKLRNLGKDEKNPFAIGQDIKTMQQFHDLVPVGGWYKVGDTNYQRTVPPPGAAAAPVM